MMEPDNFAPVLAALRAANWPGVEESLSYGTPALKVRGKMIARLREPGVLVVRCELEEKAFLIDAEPEIYFETDHYKGYPAVLVRLAHIALDELRDILDRAWRSLATKKLIAQADPPPDSTML